jgi:hypothetical protein
MLIKASAPEIEICKLELDAETQNEICRVFSEATDDMRSGKKRILFDGSYKPHDDEYLAIENFQLCDEIKDAVRNPIGVPSFSKEIGIFPEIKTIFIGKRDEVGEEEKFVVVFQRFRKEQYISPIKWFNLFFENDTFVQEKRFGISVSDTVDCCFDERELQFISYYYARQVFDLSGYYRSATDQEVLSFAKNDRLAINDIPLFQSLANTWIRRKIALINDSGVLKNYTAAKIKALARVAGIDINVENKKIVIPTEREALKIILGFLDEEAYRGPFSQATYLANSKRKVS